ncbi:MAG: polysaccharide deacetylase family protein [Pseudomonadota bacterium]
MNPFPPLLQELDHWATIGQKATLWWRDDDAIAPSYHLDRLLGLAAEFHIPMALAVIPEPCRAGLVADLAAKSMIIAVLQHGYAHRNHAKSHEKKQELGLHRSAAAVEAELSAGFTHMQELFDGTVLPVLVPPWNRIHPDLLPDLPSLGYQGISTFGPRPNAWPVAGLRQVNCHIDVIRWRPNRAFAGEAAVVQQLVEHLAGRRLKAVDPEEPTGLLTHHLVHDQACWTFLNALCETLVQHEAVEFLSASDVFLRR